jgi:hypothetical protein
MIGEKFLASLIGIDPEWDSDENQESWERQKYIDDNDLDDDDDLLDDDDDSARKAWWQVW